mmetsp:Transcript_61113/g.189313  ORF Transcript_61113/g.189313 Transcript_61113/m.189313 type:complete len:181 (-) Transcript_61113:58-600(-)
MGVRSFPLVIVLASSLLTGTLAPDPSASGVAYNKAFDEFKRVKMDGFLNAHANDKLSPEDAAERLRTRPSAGNMNSILKYTKDQFQSYARRVASHVVANGGADSASYPTLQTQSTWLTATWEDKGQQIIKVMLVEGMVKVFKSGSTHSGFSGTGRGLRRSSSRLCRRRPNPRHGNRRFPN